jgi:hypothetical protein
VKSNLTRFLVLQCLLHDYDVLLDENDKEEKKLWRQIYCLSPRPYKHPTNDKTFVNMSLQAAFGFFLDKSAGNISQSKVGYITTEGVYEELEVTKHAHIWRFFCELFDRSHGALNLV